MTNAIKIMDSAFAWTWQASLTASLIAVVILILRAVTVGRIPAKWQYFLWLVLVARLVLPSFPVSSLSIYNLFVKRSPAVELVRTNQQRADAISQVQQIAMQGAVNSIDAHTPQTVSMSELLRRFVPFIWFLGASFFPVLVLLQGIRFRMRIGRNLFVVENVESLLDECRHRLRVRTRPRIVATNSVPSPAVYGLVRPYILMPEKMLSNTSNEELKHILLHELAHIKRGDIFMNWVLTVLLAIHWFNPILWYAFSRIRQDRELACDEHVLGVLEMDSVRAYGSTILALLQRHQSQSWVLPMTAMTDGARNLRERIERIAQYRRPTKFQHAFGLALVLFGAMIGLTNARAVEPSVAERSKDATPAGDRKELGSKRVENSLDSPVSIEFDGTELTKILKYFEEYFGIQIEYEIAKGTSANPPRVPYVKLEATPFRDALQAVLTPARLTYTVRDNTIHIVKDDRVGNTQMHVPAVSAPKLRPDHSALERALDKPVSIQFDRQHISFAIDKLANIANINIVVDARVVQPAGENSRELQDDRTTYASDGIVDPVQFDSKPVSAILVAILRPLHLTYSTVPGFVWISTHKRIDTESFEDLETRVYEVVVGKEEMTRLINDVIENAVPNIYEPYTDERMSWVIYNPQINQVMIRNTPTNLEAAEALLQELKVVRRNTQKS